ncbi:endonuclease/exonuclease/phosphatase family protein [Actinomadura syzygii]|uniref:Endonuclease/exonuclease/phosphatase domain-containing protein n=1 Tax=Actinomadura syzygii TaxID=1427538 RepID=A0A5D0TXK0_9ACTN|nr:endonuclease/exonuclease/phosphatase family protein [Actinomadura syzygii]TYC10052.1 hypothetical protein FXF65_33715 [Actinomadura syzygii]
MPEPTTIRVATCNLFEGGLDGDDPEHFSRDDSRLRQQVEVLASLKLDLIGIQEATWGMLDDNRLDGVATDLGMPWRYLGRSNLYGCNLATLIRTGDNKITVKDYTHLTGPPFVHGLTNVTFIIAGHPRTVHFLVGHSAPSSPTMRLAEAETATVHRHHDLIYVADFNAAALDDDPDTTGIDKATARGKLDKRPAETLAAAGFHDVGGVLGDRTPTVGHRTPNEDDDAAKLAYRCDRIYTTLPTETVTGYGVELGGDALSDHRIVWAEFTLGR